MAKILETANINLAKFIPIKVIWLGKVCFGGLCFEALSNLSGPPNQVPERVSETLIGIWCRKSMYVPQSYEKLLKPSQRFQI